MCVNEDLSKGVMKRGPTLPRVVRTGLIPALRNTQISVGRTSVRKLQTPALWPVLRNQNVHPTP